MRATPIPEIRQRLKDALLRARAAQAARSRKQRAETRSAASEQIRLLGELMVGASGRGGSLIYDDVAGYGSELVIEDVETSESFRHRLMTAEAMELEAGHITIDSPMGVALLGRRAGDVVEVATPGGSRRVCIVQLETLPAFLDWLDGNAWGRPHARTPISHDAPALRSGTDG
jgi:transcription elongation factor GreA